MLAKYLLAPSHLKKVNNSPCPCIMVEDKELLSKSHHFRITPLPYNLRSESDLRTQLFPATTPGPDLRLEVQLDREGRPEGHAYARSPATIAQLLACSGRELLGERVTVVPVETGTRLCLQDLDPAIIAISDSKVPAGPTYIIRVPSKQRHVPKSKTHEPKQ